MKNIFHPLLQDSIKIMVHKLSFRTKNFLHFFLVTKIYELLRATFLKFRTH